MDLALVVLNTRFLGFGFNEDAAVAAVVDFPPWVAALQHFGAEGGDGILQVAACGNFFPFGWEVLAVGTVANFNEVGTNFVEDIGVQFDGLSFSYKDGIVDLSFITGAIKCDFDFVDVKV